MKSGKDVIAQAQSGTGKTGAFVIGSLEKVDPEIEGTQIIIIGLHENFQNKQLKL